MIVLTLSMSVRIKRGCQDILSLIFSTTIYMTITRTFIAVLDMLEVAFIYSRLQVYGPNNLH